MGRAEVFLLLKGVSGHYRKQRLTSGLWTCNRLPHLEFHYPENARRLVVFRMPNLLGAEERDSTIVTEAKEDLYTGEWFLNYMIRAMAEIGKAEPEVLYDNKVVAAQMSQKRVLLETAGAGTGRYEDLYDENYLGDLELRATKNKIARDVIWR